MAAFQEAAEGRTHKGEKGRDKACFLLVRYPQPGVQPGRQGRLLIKEFSQDTKLKNPVWPEFPLD